MGVKGNVKKIALLAAGCVFLALGLLGLVLPVLPTTPFALAASLCFLKSSLRLHRWVTGHPVLGPRIQRFRTRGITVREKVCIYCAVCAMILPVIVISRSLHLRVFLIVLLAVKAFVFMRIKTASREAPDSACNTGERC
jgi:uncharacterized membrane protein YbaN (DUF454 family)